MHLRSICVHIARISGDVEVLVLLFQEQLGVSCGSFRVWRNGNTEGLQELSDVEELGGGAGWSLLYELDAPGQWHQARRM